MKYILVILSIAYSSASFAGIETDKDAGVCSAYLMISNKSNGEAGAQTALEMADKEQRALNFGREWIRKLARDKDNESIKTALVYQASSACRKLGIRPSDYN